MTSKEALESIKNWVEYITRLDYVEPIVRGEVKQLLYDAYHKTTPEFEQIQKDLEILEIIKKYCDIELFYEFAFNRYLLSFTAKDKTKDTFDTPISKEDAEEIMKCFDYLKAQDSVEDNSKDKEAHTT